MTTTNSVRSERAAASNIDSIGWGLFFIWVGTAFLLDVGWPVGVLGVGLIMIGAQVARGAFRLRVDRFGLVLGACLAGCGTLGALGISVDAAPIVASVVPALLIAAGVAVLLSAWRHRPRA